MDSSTTTQTSRSAFRSPTRILIPKLVHSRDTWKAKAARRKHQLKQAQIRVRDLTASRQRWKARALAAEQQAHRLQEQLQQAQGHLEHTRAALARLHEEKKTPCP